MPFCSSQLLVLATRAWSVAPAAAGREGRPVDSHRAASAGRSDEPVAVGAEDTHPDRAVMGKGQESQVARSASVEVRYVPQFDDTAHAAQGRTSRLSSRDALRRVTRDFTETWSFGRGVRPHRSGSFHRDQPPRGQGLGSVVGLGAAADPGCEAGHADADDARPAGSSTGSRSTDLVRVSSPSGFSSRRTPRQHESDQGGAGKDGHSCFRCARRQNELEQRSWITEASLEWPEGAVASADD